METGLEIWDQPYEGPYSSDGEFSDENGASSAKRLSATKRTMRQKRLRHQNTTSNSLQRAFATATATKASLPMQLFPEKTVEGDAIYQALLKEFDDVGEKNQELKFTDNPSPSSWQFQYHNRSGHPSDHKISPLPLPSGKIDHHDLLFSVDEGDFGLLDCTSEFTKLPNHTVEEKTDTNYPLIAKQAPPQLAVKKVLTSSNCNRNKFASLLSGQLSIGTRETLIAPYTEVFPNTTIGNTQATSESPDAPKLDDSDAGINFYWLDAFDKHNGSVILIGKVAFIK